MTLANRPHTAGDVWSNPENVDRVRTMWLNGSTAAEIAVALGQGVTRNAVIGKVTRMKLPPRGKTVPVRDRNPRMRPAGAKPTERSNGHGAKGLAFKINQARKDGLGVAEAMEAVLGRQKMAPLPVEDDAGVDVTHLVGFADRRIGRQCAWIHGEPTDGAMCCGKPVKEGTEWCPDHHARVFSGKSPGF